MDDEGTIPLPERCCARCLWWRPNRVTNFKAGDTKTCWKHDEAREDEDFCEFFIGSDSLAVNVPQHTPNGIMIQRNRPIENIAVEGLIVTFGSPVMRCSGKVVSELDWLEHALQAWTKYCKGVQGLTVAHPNHETHLFVPFAKRFDIRLHGYDEVQGKGFLQHQVMIGSADTFLPKSTTHVLHFDSDCVFRMATTPLDYFHNDKPIYLYRTYESLIERKSQSDPTIKVIQDNYQWKEVGDKQLGFNSEIFGMTRHPSILPINFYAKYREQIERVHGRSFLQYHLEGKNNHPQDRCDFSTYCSFAWERMRDSFHWFNVGDGSEYPVDRLQAFWSHKGVDQESKNEIDKIMRGEYEHLSGYQ